MKNKFYWSIFADGIIVLSKEKGAVHYPNRIVEFEYISNPFYLDLFNGKNQGPYQELTPMEIEYYGLNDK